MAVFKFGDGSPCILTSFFRLSISCSVAENIRSKFKVSQKKRFLPPACGGMAEMPGISDQIFQITVISEYVSKFGWDPFSDLTD